MARPRRAAFEIDLRQSPPSGEEGPDEVVAGGPVMVTSNQAKGVFRLGALTGLVGVTLGLLVGAVVPFDGIETGLRVLIGGLVGLTAGVVAGFIGGAFQAEAAGDVDDIARDPEFTDEATANRSRS